MSKSFIKKSMVFTMYVSTDIVMFLRRQNVSLRMGSMNDEDILSDFDPDNDDYNRYFHIVMETFYQ